MEQNKKRRSDGTKHILSLLLVVLLVAATFFILLRNSDLHQLGQSMEHVKIPYILLGIFMMVFCVACEGECARVILRSLGCRISVGKSFVYSCSDYYFSAITPSATGGQPAMAYYMSRDGIHLSKSSVALLLTLIQYMGVLVLLGIAAFFIEFDFIMKSHRIVLIMTIVGVILSCILVGACLFAMFSKTAVRIVGDKLIWLCGKMKLVKHVEVKTKAFHQHLSDYHSSAVYIKEHPGISIRVFMICILQRLALFSITYFIYKSFGLTGYTCVEIIALQTLATLAVSTLPLPGAVGVAESMFLVLFVPVFGTALNAPAMLLTRGINYYFCMVFTGIVTLINHVRGMKKLG